MNHDEIARLLTHYQGIGPVIARRVVSILDAHGLIAVGAPPSAPDSRPGARERVRVPGSFAEGASPCAPPATPAPGDARLVAQLSRGRSSERPARRTGRGAREVSPRIPGATTPRGAA